MTVEEVGVTSTTRLAAADCVIWLLCIINVHLPLIPPLKLSGFVFPDYLSVGIQSYSVQLVVMTNSVSLQLPIMLWYHTRELIDNPPSAHLTLLLMIAAVAYHLQSVTVNPCTVSSLVIT